MLLKKIKKITLKSLSLVSSLFWVPRDFLSLLFKGQKLKDLRLNIKIGDHHTSSHTFDKHYVYMDRWALSRLLQNRPRVHVDIGSSINFVAMASLVSGVTYVDIRQAALQLPEISFRRGSILELPFGDNSVESISCLHVAEHVGLGRYGDGVEPKGTERACAELRRVLSPGGKLYFALPVGKKRVYFNAHRVLPPSLILEYFSGLKLLNFAAVDDSGKFFPTSSMQLFEHSRYSCGMFEFTKE